MAQINRESSLVISVGTGEQPPAFTEGGKNPFNCIGKKLGFTIYAACHPPSHLLIMWTLRTSIMCLVESPLLHVILPILVNSIQESRQ
jgi:hypothetical protein